jgi:hypothetical protein
MSVISEELAVSSVVVSEDALRRERPYSIASSARSSTPSRIGPESPSQAPLQPGKLSRTKGRDGTPGEWRRPATWAVGRRFAGVTAL